MRKINCYLIIGLAVCHAAIYWDKLPEQVASHFDGNWNPDGWMPRDIFMYFYMGTVGLIALSFLGPVALIRKIPLRFISLPNRDYWLAPDRKEATIRAISGDMYSFHNITQIFIIALMHLVIMYNIDRKPISPDTFWMLFWAYMLYMVYWTIRLMRRYSRKPE